MADWTDKSLRCEVIKWHPRQPPGKTIDEQINTPDAGKQRVDVIVTGADGRKHLRRNVLVLEGLDYWLGDAGPCGVILR